MQEQWPMNKDDKHNFDNFDPVRTAFYDVRAVPAKEYDTLCIVVEYSDGLVVEKELIVR